MSQLDSQETTDEPCDANEIQNEKDSPTEPYKDNSNSQDYTAEQGYVTLAAMDAEREPEMKRHDRLVNWPHEHQPGWSQYSESAQNSQASKSASSPTVELTQRSLKPFDPPRHPEMSRVVVPETPQSAQKKGASRTIDWEKAEEMMKKVAEHLEPLGYTVFTNEIASGSYKRKMQVPFSFIRIRILSPLRNQ